VKKLISAIRRWVYAYDDKKGVSMSRELRTYCHQQPRLGRGLGFGFNQLYVN
jgi:hypothetical protein